MMFKSKTKKSHKEIVVKTTTDEFYFPCRLIYRVLDHSEVLEKLKSIKCIGKDPADSRWCINCEEEALESKWKPQYRKQLEKGMPIVIGVIRFAGRTKMNIYLRCFNRVVPVLRLIDKYVPRSAAIGTHTDICYRLITTQDPKRVPTPEEIFSHEKAIY